MKVDEEGYMKFDHAGERYEWLFRLAAGAMGRTTDSKVGEAAEWLFSGTEEEKSMRWAGLLTGIVTVMAGSKTELKEFLGQVAQMRELLITTGIMKGSTDGDVAHQ